MRALLVVNPTATATNRRVRDVLTQALAGSAKLDVAETRARGHAVELARQAAAEGLDVVVALGGDGTVNEVVNGLMDAGALADRPALAVVPGGSTNVFARALGLPADAVEATGALLEGLRAERRRTIGLGRAGERWFTFSAGLGLAAAVVRRVDAARAQGQRARPGLFVREGVREFVAMDRAVPGLALERPSGPPTPLGLALVLNTDPWTYLGTRPVRPGPSASFDLGLDLFGLRRLRLGSMARSLRQILAADPRPHGPDVLRLHDVPALTLTAARPVPLEVDGDYVGDYGAVTFRAVRRALHVVV